MLRRYLLSGLVLAIGLMACAQDEVSLSETEQGICTEGCNGYVGEVWQACVDTSCGGTGGGGAGLSGGGGGGTSYHQHTCSLVGRQYCDAYQMEFHDILYCCTSNGYNLSCSVQYGGCIPVYGPYPYPAGPILAPPNGSGGGGGSTNPPCHGSGCQVEQGQPTSPL